MSQITIQSCAEQDNNGEAAMQFPSTNYVVQTSLLNFKAMMGKKWRAAEPTPIFLGQQAELSSLSDNLALKYFNLKKMLTRELLKGSQKKKNKKGKKED